MEKLLIMNPGSTSTKIAVYEDEKEEPIAERQKKVAHQSHEESVDACHNGKEQETPVRSESVKAFAFENLKGIYHQFDGDNKHHYENQIMPDGIEKISYRLANQHAKQCHNALCGTKDERHQVTLRRFVVRPNQPDRARCRAACQTKQINY